MSAWANVPPHMRSVVRSFINSEADSDREQAHALCRRYYLDYAAMRAVILAEMVEELGKGVPRWWEEVNHENTYRLPIRAQRAICSQFCLRDTPIQARGYVGWRVLAQ
jgi:hypothetical protein